MKKLSFIISKAYFIRPYQCDLSYLLGELVIIDLQQIESDFVKMLNEHDFSTDASAEDFTKEYDYLESKMPNPAVMLYSTEGQLFVRRNRKYSAAVFLKMSCF